MIFSQKTLCFLMIAAVSSCLPAPALAGDGDHGSRALLRRTQPVLLNDQRDIEALVRLPKKVRAQAIQQILQELREDLILEENGAGAYRTQLTQVDQNRLALFTESLAFLKSRAFDGAIAAEERNNRTVSIGMATLVSTVVGGSLYAYLSWDPYHWGATFAGAMVAYLGGLFSIATVGSTLDKPSPPLPFEKTRRYFPFFDALVTAIANDPEIIALLQRRAELDPSLFNGQEESQKLLALVTSCNRLLKAGSE